LSYGIAYGLGVCYTYTQEYPRAIEWLQKSVALAPDFAEGRFALGKALFHNGQSAEAISELRASVEREPRMKEAYALLGRVYSKLGRLEEAKAAVQKFAELDRAEARGTELKVGAAVEPKQ
jgi:Flp pilus assembly protein TadD